MTSAINILKLRSELAELPTIELRRLAFKADWVLKARPKQCAPRGDWRTWMILSGRGWGKTRVGGQWACEKALSAPNLLVAVIAPTHDLLMKVCFEGESGIMSILDPELIENYNKSSSIIYLKNGSQIQGYSAQEPERLRGPQFHYCWADEFAAWQYIQSAHEMLTMCLRLGTHPQLVITTTPKPIKLIRDLMKAEGTITTRGTTYENKANLAPTFFNEIAKYEGTQIGRQELMGEMLDFEESGIFKRSWFKLWPRDLPDEAKKKLQLLDGSIPFPKLQYVMQSYDTAFKIKVMNDPSACSVWGVFRPHDKAPLSAMLLDCWSERMIYPDLRARVQKEYNCTYGPDDKKVDLALIEDKGSGQSLVQDLNRAGIPAMPYNPGRADKIERAHGVSHFVKQGFIWLPESAKIEGTVRNWAQPFVDQVCQFGPDTVDQEGEHDDFVDTLTQALAWLRDSEMLRMPKDPVDDLLDEEPMPYRNPYAA